MFFKIFYAIKYFYKVYNSDVTYVTYVWEALFYTNAVVINIGVIIYILY